METASNRGDDLLLAPVAEAGCLVGRQIGTEEYAEIGDRESDIRAAEIEEAMAVYRNRAGASNVTTSNAACSTSKLWRTQHWRTGPLDCLRRAAVRSANSEASRASFLSFRQTKEWS